MGAGVFARRAAKAAAAGFFYYSGARKAMAAWRRHQSGGCRVTIVNYHRVVADFTGEVQRSLPGALISQETFRRHLVEADAAGYQFATLDEALGVMSGQKTSRKDLFVVNFDDGYRDVYRYAFPVLKAMGIPAIVYVPTGFIGTDRRFNHDRLFHLLWLMRSRRFRPALELLPPAAGELLAAVAHPNKPLTPAMHAFLESQPSRLLLELIQGLEHQLGGGRELLPEHGDPMTWEEIRKMSRAGIDFGAHTVGHIVLTQEPPEVVDRELRESKQTLEAQLDRKVEHFAYCNGWYSDELIEALKRVGYRSAVTTEDLPNQIGGNPFALRRKVLWENFSIGLTGDYSSALTTCQLDDVFGFFGMNHPVPGRRPQRSEALPIPSSNTVTMPGVL